MLDVTNDTQGHSTILAVVDDSQSHSIVSDVKDGTPSHSNISDVIDDAHGHSTISDVIGDIQGHSTISDVTDNTQRHSTVSDVTDGIPSLSNITGDTRSQSALSGVTGEIQCHSTLSDVTDNTQSHSTILDVADDTQGHSNISDGTQGHSNANNVLKRKKENLVSRNRKKSKILSDSESDLDAIDKVKAIKRRRVPKKKNKSPISADLESDLDQIDEVETVILSDSEHDSDPVDKVKTIKWKSGHRKKRKRLISTDSERDSDSENHDPCKVVDSDNSENSDIFPMLNTKKIKKTIHKDADFEDPFSTEDCFKARRDITNKEIFVSLVEKSDVSKSGIPKTTDRVYNSRFPCPFCDKTVSNFSHHITAKKHAKEDDVIMISQEEDGKKRKILITKLRLKTVHNHNMTVLDKGKGEVKILRRSSGEMDEEEEQEKTVDISKYGPCPYCLGWVLLRSIKRHLDFCISKIDSVSPSKGELIVQSDVLAGKISEDASSVLRKEVFPIMQIDTVSDVAKKDGLIIQLGNQWMMRNRGNLIMRKYYTSSIMRLSAKFKIACQQLSKTNTDLDEFFQPNNFSTVVKAALHCSHVNELDEEDLKSPSNSIKLGHEIKRMVSVKLAKSIVNGDEKRKKEAEEFLKLMELEWGLRVTKLARILLTERSFNEVIKLPLPCDVKKLATFLQSSLGALKLDDYTFSNFKKTAMLTLARLTLFNRRRCHEVQAMRLKSYAARKKGIDEVGQELRGELTKFECQLLETQEMVEIRGKTGRGVPVILPPDVLKPLLFLSDSEIRQKVGIQECNPYVFANRSIGVFRAYDAIRDLASDPEAGLQQPDLVRSSKMRKYMATMLQALNTTKAERQWVIDHLGHTMNVHQVHYRQTSDVLERVDVAKILLIQDLGLVSKYKGKKLDEINLEEIAENAVQTPEIAENAVQIPAGASGDATEPVFDNSIFREHQPEVDEDYIPEVPNEVESDGDDYDFPATKKKKRRQQDSPTVRQRWTNEEIEELKELFKSDFETNTTPGQKRIEAMMSKSRKNKGFIYERKRDTIKKKLSNLMIQRRSSCKKN